MTGLNRAMLIGNLCADPEVRRFSDGGGVCNLRLATSERWKDKQTGERKEKAEFHSVALFGEGLVNTAERYLRKGSKIFIEGQLQTRKWTDKDGGERYKTEIIIRGMSGKMVMLDGRKSDDPPMSGDARDHDLDDEIPF